MGDSGSGSGGQTNASSNGLFDPLDVMAQAAEAANSQPRYNQQQRRQQPQSHQGQAGSRMLPTQPPAPSSVDERALWDMLQDHNAAGNIQGNPQSMYASYAQQQQQQRHPQQSFGDWNTSSYSAERPYSNAYGNQFQRSQRQQPSAPGNRMNVHAATSEGLQSISKSHDLPETSLDASPSDLLETSTPAEIATKQEDEEEDTKELYDIYRPKMSIPLDITAEEFAKQGVEAAVSSRLPPYALHPDEYTMLRQHITTQQVTTYLNIRNAIVRLWVRNPLVAVTKEEAAGCAKEYRYLRLALVAHEFLVRNGYINFGCIEVPPSLPGPTAKRRKTVVVIGAGVAGLGCARQIETLCGHFGKNEEPPRVVLLEARNRMGGRVYSHPLESPGQTDLPDECRSTADLGAQVVTGFERGNPLDMLIRGQLALHIHSLRDHAILYDVDGKEVDRSLDSRAESLYNDILDRVSSLKVKPNLPRPFQGDRDLIDISKDGTDGGDLLQDAEGDDDGEVPLGTGTNALSAGVDKITGRAATATGSSSKVPASKQLTSFGFELRPNAPEDATIQPKPSGAGSHPTLGKTMDNVLGQLQRIAKITPQDLRLVNWHYANLEYANATNVANLSLGHWDQDDGNEFRGAHAMIIGGYIQLVRGLALAPSKLDVIYNSAVSKISHAEDDMPVKIECANGKTVEADAVVCTVPLGVLKSRSIDFQPPLPDWKTGAIERLGFGLLNKAVLVYEEAFWDVDRDMTGLLREPVGDENQQSSYEKKRGSFYMFWNCTKTAGRPMLVALMAGEAAAHIEEQTDEAIVREATQHLSKMYKKTAPKPVESIITRWRKDPFSRGTYSFVGQEASGDDYDLMAKPVGGSLFFAGEASCRTHPATVHGAYISGLRAAATVFEELYGGMKLPTTLIPARTVHKSSASVKKRKLAEQSHSIKARDLRDARIARDQEELELALLDTLGERPQKPSRGGGNPFLIFQKEAWEQCKAECEEARRRFTRGADSKVGRNEIRAALGRMWRELPDDKKRPFIEQAEQAKTANRERAEDFKSTLQSYDDRAEQFRQRWGLEHPSVPTEEELHETRLAEQEQERNKKTKRERAPSNGYDNEDDSELDPDFQI